MSVFVDVQRLIDALQEIVLPEWFTNEIQRSLAHGFNRHGNITMTSDDYDGQSGTHLLELLLQVETGHARHADVEYQAPALVIVVGIEKMVGGLIELTRQTHRRQ